VRGRDISNLFGPFRFNPHTMFGDDETQEFSFILGENGFLWVQVDDVSSASIEYLI
jgi:hypothetical protein